MHNSDLKNQNLKSFIKLALIIVLILILGILFFNMWMNEYHTLLRIPYRMKGNIFFGLVYMVLLYIFMVIYDCNNLSVNKTTSIIFSESLAAVTTNILVYFVMITPALALGLIAFTPIILLSIADIVVIIIWSITVRYIFRKVFPASELLLITNKNSIDDTLLKFSKRNDIYVIKEKIVYDNNLNEIYDKCKLYDDIIIGDIPSEDRNDIIKHCFNNSRNIYVIPKLSDILLKYSDDIFIFDTPIYLSANFGLSVENQIFKRFFDIVFSLFIIIAFLPIWIIISLLIKLEDGGPIFFIQERVTVDNKLFNIYKFRSMTVCKDSSVVLPTLNDDDRITKIGKFIRKFHIDEIPQFINVLLGDMSVVGPRPERKEHVELYSRQIKEFIYRSKVKAGITGLAQIYGKYNTTAIDKLKLDLIYIKKYSFMFDIELILRTLKVFIIKDNTEGFDIKSQKYIMQNAK